MGVSDYEFKTCINWDLYQSNQCWTCPPVFRKAVLLDVFASKQFTEEEEVLIIIIVSEHYLQKQIISSSAGSKLIDDTDII